ncbi:MAG TPA: hypothetical protein VKH19_20000 [Gemmatimonadaceae bacterium]|nr:hypothetical protein [Gemmatimonadaceae bacterium]
MTWLPNEQLLLAAPDGIMVDARMASMNCSCLRSRRRAPQQN